MKRVMLLAVAVLTAVFTACQPPASNSNANTSNSGNASNGNAAKPAAAAPTKESLMTMEKAGWEAWKNRDAKWSEENYSDKAVNFTSAGRANKAAVIKAFTEQKCEIKSYSLSDDQMQMVGPDVAVLTFRASQDYTCDEKKGPTDVRSTSIYVREGDKWKALFYGETPVTDSNAAPKPPSVVKKEETAANESKPDALTEAILAQEKKTWEGWKNKDAKPLEEVLGPDFMFYMGDGRHDRAGTIKMWTTDNKCDVKSYSISEPAAVMLTSDVALLTLKGGGDGTCGGQPIMTEWYVTVYQKSGDVWKLSFGMGVPVS
jgi:hypothetical protein